MGDITKEEEYVKQEEQEVEVTFSLPSSIAPEPESVTSPDRFLGLPFEVTEDMLANNPRGWFDLPSDGYIWPSVNDVSEWSSIEFSNKTTSSPRDTLTYHNVDLKWPRELVRIFQTPEDDVDDILSRLTGFTDFVAELPDVEGVYRGNITIVREYSELEQLADEDNYLEMEAECVIHGKHDDVPGFPGAQQSQYCTIDNKDGYSVVSVHTPEPVIVLLTLDYWRRIDGKISVHSEQQSWYLG